MYVIYLNCAVKLNVNLEQQLLVNFLKQYFEPYFEFSEAIDNNLHKLVATVNYKLDSDIDRQDEEDDYFDIDKSKSFLRLKGKIEQNSQVRHIKLAPYLCDIYFQEETITVNYASIEQARVPSLRLIEDLVSNELQNSGYILLHASAVELDSKAVLFIGNKGAGKTTLLSRALGNFDCNKIANDNAFVWFDDDILRVRGWPSFFKAQIGTVATTCELTEDYPYEAINELTNDEALWSFYEKVALYPKESAERFNKSIVPQSIVETIILPKFSDNHIPTLRESKLKEVVVNIKEYLQGVGNPNHNTSWMDYNNINNKKFEDAFENFRHQLSQTLKISAFYLDWAPSAVDLMSRIPTLRKSNNNFIKAENSARRKWQSL